MYNILFLNKKKSAMIHRQLGNSGLKVPIFSLGLWHNFGESDNTAKAKEIIYGAFDLGIVHFDLANVYGPPVGSAEINFGKIFKKNLLNHRDEMLIASKAGHPMNLSPYADWCSRKSLISGCDQSLKRVGVDYFDIFYAHRYDPHTPLEETMTALDYIVRSGRALYIGLSKYPLEKAKEAYNILKELGTPCVANQERYSLLCRNIEQNGIISQNVNSGVGTIAFSALAQGQLTNKYLVSIPDNSRAAKETGFLKIEEVNKNINTIKVLNEIAKNRNQTLAQMSLAWILHDNRVNTVLTGASSLEQLKQSIKATDNLVFTSDELNLIDKITTTSIYL